MEEKKPIDYVREGQHQQMINHLLKNPNNAIAIVGFNGTEIVKETIKSSEADIFVEQIKVELYK